MFKYEFNPRQVLFTGVDIKHHYRLYDKNRIFLRECFAKDFTSAEQKLKTDKRDKVFAVEKDNHEIECGAAWVQEMLRGDL